jgi:hypothetical protein
MCFFCHWQGWWGTTSWYCTFYHNPSQLSTSKPNLCHQLSNGGMGRIDGARQCCDNSLLILQKLLSMFHCWFYCWLHCTILLWTKSLCDQSVVNNSIMLNIALFGFQLSMQICMIQSMACIICLSQCSLCIWRDAEL